MLNNKIIQHVIDSAVYNVKYIEYNIKHHTLNILLLTYFL